MRNLKKMSVKEIENLAAAAKAEISARMAKNNNKIAKVRQQVERRLAKVGLNISDLYPSHATRKKSGGTARKSKVQNKKRSTVKPKYKDTTGQNKWTGRGRSPVWVREICEREGIDVRQFKALDEYRI